MPAKPRSATIDLTVSGTYHAFARCVRRSFLLGEDVYANKDFSHRKRWIRKRVRYLARHFAVDLLFFGFLSNHYHLVIRNLPQLVEGWEDDEVLRRACKIFPWKFARLGVVKCGEPTQEELDRLLEDHEMVQQMRARLADPSWFMRQLNQYLARRANLEDECPGHFFEQRFQAERIHDLFGLVVCGLYVDLNEIAAGIVQSPHDSTQTSVFARLRARELRNRNRRYAFCVDGYLAPVFERGEPDRYPPAGKFGAFRASDTGLLDLSLDDYVEVLTMLVDHHRKMKKINGKKPALPKDEIESLLSKKGLLANITADIAV